MIDENIFMDNESEVRSYCRNFPVIFSKAENYFMYDTTGREYIDFFSGAGALNYGHNNHYLKSKIIDYIENNGITHSLDMYTEAKGLFIESFNENILIPRHLKYKIQFSGPTGANSVEAALKLARKVTGRQNVVAFTNAFHGMTLGALAMTARTSMGIPLPNVTRMPFDGYFGDGVDTLSYLEKMLFGSGSGAHLPAAIIVETVQGEGGLNVASNEWLQQLQAIANREGIILIVDDVQAGCGRVDGFFSFESAGLYPDIVCMSKSISGYGLPMSIVLIKPEFDLWAPGEHNGTFRGGNLAFIGATTALEYWKSSSFRDELITKSDFIKKTLTEISTKYLSCVSHVRGKGMLQGIHIEEKGISREIAKECFIRGLVIETCGSNDEVIKLMPPLTIDMDGLIEGMVRLDAAIEFVLCRDSTYKVESKSISENKVEPVN